MNIRNHLTVVAAGILLISCDEKPQIGGAISDAGDTKKAAADLSMYNDTVNAAWSELDKADSAKIADISRLVLEISYSRGGINPADFTDLQNKLKEVQTKRLTEKDQTDGKALQAYDDLTDSLYSKTLRITNQLKKAKKAKPIMGELEQAISNDEDLVIIKQMGYDEAARKYNGYYNAKKDLLIQADSSNAAKGPKAYFNNEPIL